MPSPSADQIEVVPFSLEIDATELATCEAALSDDERARAARFVKPDLHRRFVAARGRLRQLLAERLHATAAELRFDYNAHGKPRLAGDLAGALEFNLSHSGEAAVAAFSSVGPVGVDIERIRTCVDHRGLARRFFSDAENRLLNDLSGDPQREAFFAIWTRKEAVIKALGVGLSLPLDRFSVGYAAEDTTIRWHGEVPQHDAATLPIAELQTPKIELPRMWQLTYRAAVAYTSPRSATQRVPGRG